MTLSAAPRPVRTPSQAETLEEILADVERLRLRRRRPVLLFDIDDTLLSTAGRHLRILKEFASYGSLQETYPADILKLMAVTPAELRYSITDTAAAAGVTHDVVLKALRDYWFGNFFDNEYLREDRPVEGAPAYLQEALVRGARLVYLTGRDESMRPGTLESLSDNGFPMPDGAVVQLMLKPAFDTPDHAFKRDAMERVAGLGEVAGAFENEPLHANLFHETFPAAVTALVETHHSGRPVEPLAGVRRIRDFIRS